MMRSKTETIVFGGGCFWCTEAVFEMMKGVVKTEPGYAGGSTPNPSYEDVCTGFTGHAEVLRIEYDPNVVKLEKLLDIFVTMHDPTSLNQQGADVGTQYRSMVLYSTDEQKKKVEAFLKSAQRNYKKPIVTEVKKLEQFYPAEDYHRNYFDKNPNKSYCTFVIKPKVDKAKKEFASELK